MTWQQILPAIAGFLFGASFVAILAKGILRRHPHWSRDSWTRFGLACGTMLVILFIPVFAELAIDAGLLSRGGLGSDARGVWAIVSLIVMLAGATALTMILRIFVNGDPTERFPGALWRSDRPAPRRSA